jgi:hypothetical protein
MASQIIPLKGRADLPHPRWISGRRPFAFELQRWEYAAWGWVLPGLQQGLLQERWPSFGVAEEGTKLAALSFDQKMIGRRQS